MKTEYGRENLEVATNAVCIRAPAKFFNLLIVKIKKPSWDGFSR